MREFAIGSAPKYSLFLVLLVIKPEMQANHPHTSSRHPLNSPVPEARLLLSVVIPICNEAGNILPLTREITQELQRIAACKNNYEIVFVDDGSTDNSRAEINTAAQEMPHIRLINHNIRAGKSQAVRSGVRLSYGQWILTLDGDGQNDPADFKNIIAKAWEAGHDKNRLVCGVRQNRMATKAKRWASRAANAIRKAILKDESPDAGCGLKIYRRDTHLALPYFDNMHRYDQTLYALYGVPVHYVPVNDRTRQHGLSKYTNWQRALVGIVDLLGLIWLQNRKTQNLEIQETALSATPQKSDIAAE